MAYKKRQEDLVFTGYGHDEFQPPLIHVALTAGFVRNWQNGRYANLHNTQSLSDFFNSRFPIGYVEQSRSKTYRLRFPDQRLTLPLHQNGSANSMEAGGFYHERRPFQLGKRKMRSAKIKTGEAQTGIVEISWKTMY